MTLRRWLICGAALALMALQPLSAALLSYEYLLDTSSVTGDANLYFALAPSTDPTPPVTATITGFVLSGGGLLGAPVLIGAASGLLPGPVELTNTDARNEYNQDLTLGSSLRFVVTLDVVAAPPGGSPEPGSTFAFGIFRGATPLFTDDEFGDIARIQIDSNGNATTEGLAPVPEPGTAWLLAGSLFAYAFARRRRRQ